MFKYNNPFHTINEAVTVLVTHGADPIMSKSAGSTYAFPWGDSYVVQDEIYWQEHILSVAAIRVYSGSAYHYKVEIHILSEGFDRVLELIRRNSTFAPEVVKVPHSDEYDMHYIEPDTLLRIFKLVPKEVTE